MENFPHLPTMLSVASAVIVLIFVIYNLFGDMLSDVAAMLTEAGLAPADVVSVTTYAVVGQELGPVMAARDRFLGGRRAASTLVTVPALARPEWLVEVAVVAAR